MGFNSAFKGLITKPHTKVGNKVQNTKINGNRQLENEKSQNRISFQMYKVVCDL